MSSVETAFCLRSSLFYGLPTYLALTEQALAFGPTRPEPNRLDLFLTPALEDQCPTVWGLED
jgi:hypothetical protein